jgi:hypothetical protein
MWTATTYRKRRLILRHRKRKSYDDWERTVQQHPRKSSVGDEDPSKRGLRAQALWDPVNECNGRMKNYHRIYSIFLVCVIFLTIAHWMLLTLSKTKTKTKTNWPI